MVNKETIDVGAILSLQPRTRAEHAGWCNESQGKQQGLPRSTAMSWAVVASQRNCRPYLHRTRTAPWIACSLYANNQLITPYFVPAVSILTAASCNMHPATFFFPSLLLFHFSLQASPTDWRSRSIYQIVTDRFALTNGSETTPCDASLGNYCGGSWKGITNQLDYVENMGFDAIWISPITKQLEQRTGDNESYHGYWQQDLYTVNEHFGSPQDLVELSQELHERAMFLMIDMVVGQMAWPGAYDTVDYSVFVPFNQQSSFHPFCSASEAGDNQTAVEDCWLGDSAVSLPDLRTEDNGTAQVLYDFVSDTIKNYTADGIRIDSVINLNSQFLPGLTTAAGVYAIGEVLQGNTTAACGYQDLLDGFLDYPLYFPLTRVFQDPYSTMSEFLDEILLLQSSCKTPSLLGTFSENHDNPRFASYTEDMSLAANVLTFDLMYDGIPVIYYGQEQHFNGTSTPMNREALWLSGYNDQATLYQLTATLNALRSQVIKLNDSYLDYSSDVIYSDDHNVAFRKGHEGNQVVTILNNNGANNQNFTLTVSETGFPMGANITEIVGCTTTIAGSNGTLTAVISNGMPAIYASSQIVGKTTICQPANTTAAVSPSIASQPTSARVTTIATRTAIPKLSSAGTQFRRNPLTLLAITFIILFL